MNLLLGYFLLVVYFFVIFFFFNKIVKKKIGIVLSRKIIHILSGFSWFIYDYFIGCSFHQIIISGLFLILMVFSKRFNLLGSIENTESESNGTIYYALALFLILTISYCIPSLYPYVGFSIVVLSIGDGAATLVGRYIKSIDIYHGKTLFGFLGCIVFSFISLVLYNYVFDKIFTLYELFLISLIAGIFEEEDFKGLDNITVALSAFISMVLLKNCENIAFSISIFCILFLVCFFFKIMTYHGSLLSSFIGASFLYIGGFKTLIFISFLYLILIFIHILRKSLKVKENDIVKKTKGKDFMQVFSNGFVSLVYLYIYFFINNPILLVMSLLVFSNSFVDSIASDIGSISKEKPFDVFKKIYVEPGTSGGISVLGTVSAFIASLIFTFTIYLLFNTHYLIIVFGPVLMMICCFTDSFLGSKIQAKYKCSICSIITEKDEHCDVRTKLIEGYYFFDNDIVNLTCSILCGILCIPLAILLV